MLRHPIVIAGNAIFTIVLLLAVVTGVGVYWGKQNSRNRDRCRTKRWSISRADSAFSDIGELLAREGVIADPWVFVGGAVAPKARGGDLKFGEYEFAKGASPRAVAETLIEGKVSATPVHRCRRPDIGTDRRQAFGERQADGFAARNAARRLAPARVLSFRAGRTSRRDRRKRMQASQQRVLKEA